MHESTPALTAADVDRAALTISCPVCGALARSRCTAGGYGYKPLRRPHLARRNAAQEATDAR